MFGLPAFLELIVFLYMLLPGTGNNMTSYFAKINVSTEKKKINTAYTILQE